MGETNGSEENNLKIERDFPAKCDSKQICENSKQTIQCCEDLNNNQSQMISEFEKKRRGSLPALDEDRQKKILGRYKKRSHDKESTSAQNVTKLSPIKLQHPQTKDLGTKIKNKRDPLPMKLRALPRSFWQQPNQTAAFSPAPLPPLNISSHRYEDTAVPQSVSSSHNQENTISMVSDANTDLLFSLFNTVENQKTPQKRGRPKKMSSASSRGNQREDDPCLMPSGLLPALAPSRPHPDTPKVLNYSQLLNELVFQL